MLLKMALCVVCSLIELQGFINKCKTPCLKNIFVANINLINPIVPLTLHYISTGAILPEKEEVPKVVKRKRKCLVG